MRKIKVTFRIKNSEIDYSYYDFFKVTHAYSSAMDILEVENEIETKIRRNCTKMGKDFDKITGIEEVEKRGQGE